VVKIEQGSSWEQNFYNGINAAYRHSISTSITSFFAQSSGQSPATLRYNNEQSHALNLLANPLENIPPRITNASLHPRITNIPQEQQRTFIDLPNVNSIRKIVPSVMIIGPPGTGKTMVICSAAILWVFNSRNLERSNVRKLYIATFSNAGAYRVYEKFHELANQYNAKNFYERIKLVQSHTATESFAFDILCNKVGSIDFWIPNRKPNNVSNDIWRSMLNEYLILIGTTDSLATISSDFTAHGIIYDEASQLTVPQFFQVIPDNTIMFVGTVGDDQQLPPVATLTPLSTSALTYLQGVNTYQNSPIPSARRVELLRQYRMHPAIAQLTEKILTTGRRVIPSGNTTNANYQLSGFQIPSLNHLSTQNTYLLKEILKPEHTAVIIDTSIIPDAQDKQTGASRRNPTEVKIAVCLYQALLASYPNLRKEDIIITAPYRPQIDLILGYDLNTGTVHQFQGQEAEVVIYSLTFARPDTKSDFFSKVNLMYVGLSRAKKKLIIIGNKAAINSLDPSMKHVRETIFNYRYEPRNPDYPLYSQDPVFYNQLRIDTLSELESEYL
jgi:Cdc6-like AAA superfamily ATPase